MGIHTVEVLTIGVVETLGWRGHPSRCPTRWLQTNLFQYCGVNFHHHVDAYASPQRKVTHSRCVGEHLDTLKEAARHRHFWQCYEEARDTVERFFRNARSGPCRVLVTCRQGRHRSVSYGRLITHLLARQYVVALEHLSQNSWHHTCNQCWNMTREKQEFLFHLHR